MAGMFHAEFKQRCLAMSFTPGGSTPEAFDKMIRSDIDSFVRMAKQARLRANLLQRYLGDLYHLRPPGDFLDNLLCENRRG